MITKKTFISTAKEIAAMTDKKEAKTMADNFVRIFKSSNPMFDTQRFLTACKLN